MKSLEDYQREESYREMSEKEREISDRLYAEKRTQHIVDGWVRFAKHLLTAASLGMLGLLGKVILEYLRTQPPHS